MAKKSQKLSGSAADLVFSGENPGEILPRIIIRKTTTFVLKDEDQEKGDPLSMTVPDQSMEMREIYRRYAGGRPIDASNREPLYYGDDIEVPDLQKLDLVEVAQMLEENRERVKLLRAQVDEETELQNRLENEKIIKAREEEDKRLLNLYEERQRNLLNQR